MILVKPKSDLPIVGVPRPHTLTARQQVPAWPCSLVRCAAQLPYLLELIQVRRSGKNGPVREHLAKYTSANNVNDVHDGSGVKCTYPIPHMSTSPPYWRAPSRSSGGRYQRVTTQLVYLRSFPRTSSFTCVILGSNARARPKSAIFRQPSFEMRRLAAFMSRCRIWFCDS